MLAFRLRSRSGELCRIANQCLVEFMRIALGLPEGIAGIVMVIHTFGEYLDFHPHLHALVADGLFTRSGLFYVLLEVSLRPREELFRARVITFLLAKGLLPPQRARMLRDWKHSGFNIHQSQRVGPDEDKDRERLAQYIIRSPFSLEKMRLTDPGDIVYRSEMNPKIKCNFEVFSPAAFIAAVTQHIPDKSKIPARRCRGTSSWSAITGGTPTRCVGNGTNGRPNGKRLPVKIRSR